MDRNSVYRAAFWAGLASPCAAFAATPQYRPQVCNLTFFAPFAVVGEMISLSARETDVGGEENSASRVDPEQLALSFE
jgi:hypothetical protein